MAGNQDNPDDLLHSEEEEEAEEHHDENLVVHKINLDFLDDDEEEEVYETEEEESELELEVEEEHHEHLIVHRIDFIGDMEAATAATNEDEDEDEDENEDEDGARMAKSVATNTQIEAVPSKTNRVFPNCVAEALEPISKDPAFPTLTEYQKIYGVEQSCQTLETEWGSFRSYLVDNVYHDDGQTVANLYEVSEGVVGVYNREVVAADEFGSKLYRLMNK